MLVNAWVEVMVVDYTCICLFVSLSLSLTVCRSERKKKEMNE